MKMDKDFLSEGSEKEGDVVGLREGEERVRGDQGRVSGGKSSNEASNGSVCSLMDCGEGFCKEKGERIGLGCGGKSSGTEGDS